MNYEIYLSYGSDSYASPTVLGVESILTVNETYYFHDAEGEILFAAPMEKVVYIKKK